MNPKYFGKGTWILIFKMILNYNIFDKLSESQSLEILKKLLYLLCTNLPCPICSEHAKLNILKNNIMETNDINILFHFFIEFRNGFYKRKINRKLFNDGFPIVEEKKKYLFSILINE